MSRVLLLAAIALGGLMLFPAVASAEDSVDYSDQTLNSTSPGDMWVPPASREPVTYNGTPREGAVFYNDRPITVTWDGLGTGSSLYGVECRIEIDGPDGNPMPGALRVAPMGEQCGEFGVTLSAPLEPGTYRWRWWHIAPGEFTNQRSYGYFTVLERPGSLSRQPVTYNGTPREGAVFSIDRPITMLWNTPSSGFGAVACRIAVFDGSGNFVADTQQPISPDVGHCDLSVALPPLSAGTYRWWWYRIMPGGYESPHSWGDFAVLERPHDPVPPFVSTGL